MKDLNFAKLAMVYTGCFLGAGYVSGQELRQYFGLFGVKGFYGLALAMLIFFLLGLALLRLTQMTGIFEAEKLTVPWDLKPLRLCCSFLEVVMLFAVVAIMNAGVGALAQQLFSLPHARVSAVYTVVVLACTLAGLQGIVSVFSFSVPCLVGASVLICAAVLARGGRPYFPVQENGLLGNWVISAVNFVCYNVFIAVPVIAPFGRYVKKSGTARAGVGCGTLLLLVISLGVMIAPACVPGAMDAELPMLAAASALGSWAGYGYAFLLFLAMFGTSLSCLVSVVNYFAERSERIARVKKTFTVIISAVAYFAGLFGFGDLIGLLYPIFGYCSILFTAMLLIHYFKARKMTDEG